MPRPLAHCAAACLLALSAIWFVERSQAEQQPARPQWVAGVGYSPPLATLPEGTAIRFSVEIADVPVDQLEFRLHELPETSKHWIVRQDWRPWPLDPLTPAVGRTALQIDIRKKADPNAVDMRWLGQLCIGKDQERRGKNCLMRNLLADDFNRLDETVARTSLAREAWLAIHLLLWEGQSRSPAEKLQLLRALPGVASAVFEPAASNEDGASSDRSPPRSIRVLYQSGDAYRFDPDRLTLREEGSPVTLDLSLRAYPEFDEVFRLARELSPRGQAVVGLTHLIYSGYQYGTPPFNPSVGHAVAHCVSGSRVLLECLQRNDVEADLAVITRADGALHALVQAVPSAEEPLLLDSTIGRVYRADIRKLTPSTVPAPLVLPTVRVWPGLELSTMLGGPCEVLLCRRFVDGVTPPVPVAEREILHFR